MTEQLTLQLSSSIPESFGHWLAGFVDGEGCFYAYTRKTKTYRTCMVGLEIKLRADDLPLLIMIQETLGTGNIVHRKYKPPDKPQVRLRVGKVMDLKKIIIPLFNKYPLLSKKKRDFSIWKRAVELAYISKTSGGLPDELWAEYSQHCEQLREGREYRGISRASSSAADVADYQAKGEGK